LPAEQFEARRGDDGRLDAVLGKDLRGIERDRHFRAGCDQRHVAGLVGLDGDVRAERNMVDLGRIAVKCGKRLPRQAEDRRRALRA
jgi:hypothetical protein